MKNYFNDTYEFHPFKGWATVVGERYPEFANEDLSNVTIKLAYEENHFYIVNIHCPETSIILRDLQDITIDEHSFCENWLSGKTEFEVECEYFRYSNFYDHLAEKQQQKHVSAKLWYIAETPTSGVVKAVIRYQNDVDVVVDIWKITDISVETVKFKNHRLMFIETNRLPEDEFVIYNLSAKLEVLLKE
jgi:hypothetical protein